MRHNPVPVPCPVCVVSVGGPSEPPLLDVWSELMFTVLLTECWRIWADMSPQCSLPDWLCSHIPSVRRHLRRGWATFCDSLVCVLLCLTLTLWRMPAKRQGFFFGQISVYRLINTKKTMNCEQKGYINMGMSLRKCLYHRTMNRLSISFQFTVLYTNCIVYNLIS